MKLRILFIYFFLLLGTTTLHAQKKIGVYIHGFQGGIEKWSQESLAPEKLILSDHILDQYVLLSYETGELESDNRLSLLNKFIDQIKNKTCTPSSNGDCTFEEPNLQTDQFILIGHSLGGLVARVLYPALVNHPINPSNNVNVVGVISIGSPMQGTGAANVTTDDVSAVFTSLENKLEDAWEIRSSVIDKVITKGLGKLRN
ncbi:MAG: hypothetical protein JJ895_14995 [Balneolaceae bacterium]|nr:hypothetical protein [Balneolaceae bacterium]